MPREVNKAKGKVQIGQNTPKNIYFTSGRFKPRKDFDRITEIEETPSKDQIMTEYLQHF